jgi:serine-type D-Ala-D-Ala carboxypeptidase (penicillin-binding protein 5/6)
LAQPFLKSAIYRSSAPRSPWGRLAGLTLAAAVAGSAGLAPSAARAQGMPIPPGEASPAPLGPPLCKAASAIVVDAATGAVLWEKNSRVRRPIASTTKIMTATLVLESGRLDDTVGFSEKARLTEYGNLNVKPGEKFKMRDLLYAILLRSSNDSCVAVAEHLAGSVPEFAKWMTEKAHQLGAADTNFVTPNGLFHPQHVSTAQDLAIITRYAIQNAQFNQAVATKEYTLQRTINTKDTLIRNHNKFLSKYAGADGVKTGYVRQSGRCLVASSTRAEQGNPWRLITVVLNSADTYGDSERMMDWARKNFQPVFFARRGEQVGVATVRGGSQSQVPLVVASDLMAVVRRSTAARAEREVRTDEGIPAPVRREQVGGKLVALVDGQPVAQVDLLTAQPVERVWTAAVAAGVAPWGGWSFFLMALVLGPRYARTFAKGALRRRRGLAPGCGSPDPQREGLG